MKQLNIAASAEAFFDKVILFVHNFLWCHGCANVL